MTPQQKKSTIRIVAALVQDGAGRVLLVKRGTLKFMQPGGKLHDAEPPVAALERELREELRCSVQTPPVFLGTFTAPAANEEGCTVEAALYRAELTGPIAAAAEIEEILWLDPTPLYLADLAPLTADIVLPMALSHCPPGA